MYGFGDVVNPAPDTVNVLEEMVIDYITDMVSLAILKTMCGLLGYRANRTFLLSLLLFL